MHQTDLILTLTACLTAALLAGYVMRRIGFSPIVGYLLAGMIVGPNTPGFVANHELAKQFAEVGVILLMFGVGLNFHFQELLAVRRVAVPGAIGQSAVASVLGALVARWATGMDWPAAMLYGIAISVASTVVLTRVLVDHQALHTRVGHISVGWLVIEDLLTVLVLVLMPVLANRDAGPANLAWMVGLAGIKIALLLAIVAVIGGRLVPWLLHRLAATGSRELFTLSVLVVALGIAVFAAELFGVSMALVRILGRHGGRPFGF